MKKNYLLPTLLTAVSLMLGGLTFAGQKGIQKVEAVGTYVSEVCVDPDIDVGINVKASSEARSDWTIAQFYVGGSAIVGNMSAGDYVALRVHAPTSAGSYFDMIPNFAGNPYRISLNVAEAGARFVPVNSTALSNTLTRDFDLPTNIWGGMDGWICFPKTGFTRNYWNTGNALNWNADIWAVYFMFYGTTIDTINFDIGDLWTANIDSDGYLHKVNHVIDWTKANGTNNINDTGDGSTDLLSITRNNENLVSGATLARAVADVDVCNTAACSTFYNNNHEAIDGLDSDNRAYFDNVLVYDYESGDTGHTGGKSTEYVVADKWNAIMNAAGVSGFASARLVVFDKNNTISIIILSAGFAFIGSLIVFLFIRRKRKHQ